MNFKKVKDCLLSVNHLQTVLKKETTLKILIESNEKESLKFTQNCFLIKLKENRPCNFVKKINFVGLPTIRKKYCLLRSPHTDKDSREHFEIKVYRKAIYVKTFNPVYTSLKINEYSNNKMCNWSLNVGTK
jgi:ribosomal protein S10